MKEFFKLVAFASNTFEEQETFEDVLFAYLNQRNLFEQVLDVKIDGNEWIETFDSLMDYFNSKGLQTEQDADRVHTQWLQNQQEEREEQNRDEKHEEYLSKYDRC